MRGKIEYFFNAEVGRRLFPQDDFDLPIGEAIKSIFGLSVKFDIIQALNFFDRYFSFIFEYIFVFIQSMRFSNIRNWSLN